MLDYVRVINSRIITIIIIIIIIIIIWPPVEAQNLAVPGATPKMGEDPSEVWLNRHAKFHTDR